MNKLIKNPEEFKTRAEYLQDRVTYWKTAALRMRHSERLVVTSRNLYSIGCQFQQRLKQEV